MTECAHPTHDISTKLIEGELVRRCKTCRKFSVQDWDTWILGGHGVLEQLRQLAARRDEERARERLMLESPTEAPWWEPIYGA